MKIQAFGAGIRRGDTTLIFQDISVQQGDHALILGPSGSGKTTLVSILSGMVPPDCGQVLWDGEDITKMQAQERDRQRGQSIGFIFQTLHLFPSLSLMDNILLPSRLSGTSALKKDALTLLDSLNLGAKANSFPHQLSQGERQRGAIARAFVGRPAVIMADEPTSALDDDNTNAIVSLIREQAKRDGTSVLVATHDMRLKAMMPRVIDLSMQPQKQEAA